jgi:hypothetical protein
MPVPFVKNDPRINRKGRPKKGQSLTGILDWALDQKTKIKDNEIGETMLLRQALVQKLIDKAVNDGDVTAIKYIFDRLDGKPRETIEMSETYSGIPEDPSERRILMEQIEKELALLDGQR